ncbi:MAG: hypothetical protein ABWX84_03140 [Nocardioides sp.]
MRRARRRGSATALLLVALVATGCTDDPAPENDALTGLLGDLRDDPAAARAFLVADDTAATAEVADEAGLPAEGRVTALLTDDTLQTGDAADDLAATLTAGMSDAGGATEPDRARVVREVVLAWEGDPSFDDDVRTAAAGVVADDLEPAYDDLVRAAEGETWPESSTRSFLVDAGRDAPSRAALHASLLAGLGTRLVPTPASRLEATTDEVGVPAGRLVGALDSDTGDADLLAADRDELEGLLRDWLQRNGADEEQVTNFAGDVGQAYAEEIG